MTRQRQFLDVVSVDEASRKFDAAMAEIQPVAEKIRLQDALGRILAEDIVAGVNVPNFDRSNFDGFAVRSRDIAGASETSPVLLRARAENIAAGATPNLELGPGEAIGIATGAKIPRGADAILMVEHSVLLEGQVRIQHSVAAGFGITFAASDIAAGQTVLFANQKLTSRETGILAALGMVEVDVRRRPIVAVVSTGDEIVAPGAKAEAGMVYDSNARIISDAAIENGANVIECGIAVDEYDQLTLIVDDALRAADLVILTGGTSKGEGDISYRVLEQFDDPGIVVHGVAIKPGKPVCLAATRGKPIVVLPGFPTSAIFTFHQFVAPVIRRMAGVRRERLPAIEASLAQNVSSAIGRTEFNLVSLSRSLTSNRVDEASDWIAFPMGKGSGSVTTFSQADGFFSIEENRERVSAGERIQVHLVSEELEVADFVFIGSHCVGVDKILSTLQASGRRCKSFYVGSTSGLRAIERSHGHVAGVHLLDPKTGEYNHSYIQDDLTLISGYRRRQGLVVQKKDRRFRMAECFETCKQVLSEHPELQMVNRNQGSGTRILIDQLLQSRKPDGYANCVNNHHATVAAVLQDRADWGVAIEFACQNLDGLRFIPIADEHYDFVIRSENEAAEPIAKFLECLNGHAMRTQLAVLGLESIP